MYHIFIHKNIKDLIDFYKEENGRIGIIEKKDSVAIIIRSQNYTITKEKLIKRGDIHFCKKGICIKWEYHSKVNKTTDIYTKEEIEDVINNL